MKSCDHKKTMMTNSMLHRPSFVIYVFCFVTAGMIGAFYLRLSFTAGRLGINGHSLSGGDQTCDLFKGRWIWDARKVPLYTNLSCKTLPDSKNCLLHGKPDEGYIRWRWKPDGCELPGFEPGRFLGIVRGKTLAFVGDSVARNQMDSLLCLLSTEESPQDVYKDAKDRFRTWRFPHHNFTLMTLWTRFLVKTSQTVINGALTGGFNIHLDKIDLSWSQKLPSVDITIISDAQWFFKQNYLYKNGVLMGCINCQDSNITKFRTDFAIQRAFRTAFKHINECKNCSNTLTLLRTFSPSHFENGTWKTGGSCLRKRPFTPEEANNLNSHEEDRECRNKQVAEVETAIKVGQRKGNVFGLLDVTEAMLMRPDGHPGIYWRSKKKGYSDCVHWCLPGPIDVWNELLLEVLRRHSPIGKKNTEL